MHPRTLATIAVVAVALGGLFVAGVSLESSPDTELALRWESDTARDIDGNHHAPIGATIDGTPMVFAPVSAPADSAGCALVGIHGSNGSTTWTNPIPGPNCTIHSVADPTLADFDDDGTIEVLAATTQGEVVGYTPATGRIEFRANLSTYGYTQPIVTDLLGDDRSEIVVVDVRGSVFVFDSSGAKRWSRQFGVYTWGQPSVADFDGDGAPEIAVGFGGSGEIRVFEADGDEAWDRPATVSGSITWQTTGQLDDDSAIEIIVGTSRGEVAAVDGTAGEREWTRDLGRFAAVDAVGDGDDDGTSEVYATARDGRLRSLSGATGETEWTTVLTDADVQMTPPPALGDIDGDGENELLAVTNDGAIAVVSPEDGAIRSASRRDVTIFSRPTLADLDDDAAMEVLVMYGDGRVGLYEWS